MIVIGGACDDFSYETVNRVFRRLNAGAALVAMHRNMYWRTAGGLELDAGAYIAGLEAASGTTAVICGKPAPAYFEAALQPLGRAAASEALMVGDDIENDVLGAQDVGMTGCAWCAPASSSRPTWTEATPDHVVDSIADLPWLCSRDDGGRAAHRRTGPRRPACSRRIAPQYSWMGAVMSFGQDGRWRRFMVSTVERGAGVARCSTLPQGPGWCRESWRPARA